MLSQFIPISQHFLESLSGTIVQGVPGFIKLILAFFNQILAIIIKSGI